MDLQKRIRKSRSKGADGAGEPRTGGSQSGNGPISDYITNSELGLHKDDKTRQQPASRPGRTVRCGLTHPLHSLSVSPSPLQWKPALPWVAQFPYALPASLNEAFGSGKDLFHCLPRSPK